LKVNGENGCIHINEKGVIQGYFRRNSKGKAKPENNADLFDGSFE